MRRPRLDLHLWGWPLGLGLLTLVGLLSALIGDGLFWLMLCWAALAVPIAVIIHYSGPALARWATGGGALETLRRRPTRKAAKGISLADQKSTQSQKLEQMPLDRIGSLRSDRNCADVNQVNAR